jgi:hypothetical protein
LLEASLVCFKKYEHHTHNIHKDNNKTKDSYQEKLQKGRGKSQLKKGGEEKRKIKFFVSFEKRNFVAFNLK